MTNLAEQQERIANALEALVTMRREGMLPPVLSPLLTLAPPAGMQTLVEFLDDHGEPLPEHQGTRAFDAERHQIALSFVSGSTAGHPERSGGEVTEDQLRDLVEVLFRAEENPQLQFVALKFLRDRLLPDARLGWTRSPDACQRVIGDAIDREVLMTSRTPNPRNPSFPVTAVELNRRHPEVAQLLGDRAGSSAEAPEPTRHREARGDEAGQRVAERHADGDEDAFGLE